MTNAYAMTGTTVTAYDTTSFATGGSTGVIPASGSLLGIALSPDLAHLYTTDTTTNTVTKIPVPALTVGPQVVVGTPGGNGPRSCIVSPDNNSLWVTSRGDNTVYQIDTATMTVVNTVSLGAGNGPAGIVISPDGTKIYVACEAAGTIQVIDTTTLATVATITVAGFVINLAMAPDGLTIWACAFLGGNMLQISTVSNTVIATVAVGVQPLNAFVLPDSSHVWDVDSGAGTATSIALPADTGAATVTLTSTSQDLGVTPDSAHVWTGEVGQIDVIATASNSIVHTIAGTGTIQGLVITPATYVPVVPPTGLTVGKLFIPRKGRGAALGEGYEADDYLIDWLAIERWANNAWDPKAPNLFIPCKPSGRKPTIAELDTNWLTIERWTLSIGILGGVSIPPLFIPRKTSLEATDLDIDFLAIQNWADGLNP